MQKRNGHLHKEGKMQQYSTMVFINCFNCLCLILIGSMMGAITNRLKLRFALETPSTRVRLEQPSVKGNTQHSFVLKLSEWTPLG